MELNSEQLLGLIKLFEAAKHKKDESSYVYIRNILNRLFFPIPIITYPKGTRFVRCRIHKPNEDFFRKKSELSYRKDYHNILNFGRANEPGQSMFYCANIDWLAYLETSEITRKGKNKEVEYITLSYWEAVEEITAVTMLTNDKIIGKNKDLDIYTYNFARYFNNLDSELRKPVTEFYQFLSKEFSNISENNIDNYKITCAFTNYIFDFFEQADCIIYPSSLYLEKGFNAVFDTKKVDDKLKLYSVLRKKMELSDIKEYKETEIIDCISINGENIKWKI